MLALQPFNLIRIIMFSISITVDYLFAQKETDSSLFAEMSTFTDWEYMGPRKYPNRVSISLPTVRTQPDLTDRIGIPKFIKEPPAELYVVKNTPALVECVAKPTTYLTIQCADSETAQKRSRMQPKHDIKGDEMRVYVTVTIKDVQEWFDELWCQCNAWNTIDGKPEVVYSRKTVIKSAYMDKRFKQEPISKTVPLRSQIQFICQPPDAKPTPTLHWLKNGKIIDPGVDPNFIITSEGYLVVGDARLEDSANYTCVASSIFGLERSAEPAILQVYLKGGWSEWTALNACPSECINGQNCGKCSGYIIRRNRMCNNPRPVGIGSTCDGNDVETFKCDRFCVVNGGWSSWSAWTDCTSMCQRLRHRTCTNPKPDKGGAVCGPSGSDLERKNCTEFDCNNEGNWRQPLRDDTREVVMYVGLCVAMVLFLIAVFVIAYMIRQRYTFPGRNTVIMECRDNGASGTNRVYVDRKESSKIKDLLLPSDGNQAPLEANSFFLIPPTRPPASTVSPQFSASHGTTLPNVPHQHTCTVPPLPPNLTPAQSGNAKDNINNNHTCGTPVLHGGPSYATVHESSPASSRGRSNSSNGCPNADTIARLTGSAGQCGRGSPKTLPSNTGTSSSGAPSVINVLGPAVGESPFRKTEPYHTVTLLPSNPGEMGPSAWGQDTRAAWGELTSTGGKLSLPECGVSLTIPPGAVPPGYSKEIFLAVSSNDKDRPMLENNQTLLTSLIVCGPRDVLIQGNVFLTFPHCACLKKNTWNLGILSSDKTGSEPPNWQEHVVIGQTQATCTSFCHMDTNSCHLITSQLGAFCLIGETAHATTTSQSLNSTSSTTATESLDSTNTVIGNLTKTNMEESAFPACKTLLLVAFCQPIPYSSSAYESDTPSGSKDFVIRVRVLADTKDAFERVVTMETRRGGRLLDTSKRLQFVDMAGENLCFSVEDVCEGWQPRTESKYQEIPFTHIWKNTQSNLHCSISLEPIDKFKTDVSCNICIYQSGHNQDRQVINIHNAVIQSDDYEIPNQHSALPAIPTHSMIPPRHVFRFSTSVRRQICSLLDSSYGSESNWKMLARQYGLDACIEFFAHSKSPTESFLNLWETKHREETAVIDLKKTLRAIGRSDVVAIIDHSTVFS